MTWWLRLGGAAALLCSVSDSDLGDLGAPGTSRWWDLGVVEGARQAPRARCPRLSLPLPSSVNS